MTVGLSLSNCLHDLLEGRVLFDDIVIVSGTAFITPEHAYAQYGSTYWRHHQERNVMAMLTKLWPRLVQPKLLLHDMGYSHFGGRPLWMSVPHTEDVAGEVQNRWSEDLRYPLTDDQKRILNQAIKKAAEQS